MGEVLELAERAWQGELETTQVHPGRALVGFEELAPGLGFMSAFSNVGVVATEEGLVFLDTSSFFHAKKLHAAIRGWTDARLHTAVYTHGHVDHVFGLGPFEAELAERGEAAPHVIAHEACPERFDRYVLTNGYNGIINQRQFNFPAPVFPKEFRHPDQTVARDHAIEVGGIAIELHHDKGETDDHLWAWVPAHKAIYTGDLFIWASPNCGNPQKAQRYPRDWAMALRRMQALGAETLLPGHGPPILGAARVKQALGEAAELLETLVEQTLALMNQGARLDEVVHGIELPDALLERPYLRPSYDDPRFIVRNLWRLYGGWYDGNPAHLMPAPERDLAATLAEMAGGATALADRAEALAGEGRLDLACELAELASLAAPDDAGVHRVRGSVFRQRADGETSLMAQGIFGAAARESEDRS
ncbi:MAG: MBL fold metallo-hydrolase [Deltaproteobacteria bacterium]|nr:MBL fold metallo-hydrolase [Deltaproteobacteria bacterium]MBW2448278.1 MBL fold metallo-hydrolase [Deltaproteobacteria bacterium]